MRRGEIFYTPCIWANSEFLKTLEISVDAIYQLPIPLNPHANGIGLAVLNPADGYGSACGGRVKRTHRTRIGVAIIQRDVQLPYKFPQNTLGTNNVSSRHAGTGSASRVGGDGGEIDVALDADFAAGRIGGKVSVAAGGCAGNSGDAGGKTG